MLRDFYSRHCQSPLPNVKEAYITPPSWNMATMMMPAVMNAKPACPAAEVQRTTAGQTLA